MPCSLGVLAIAHSRASACCLGLSSLPGKTFHPSYLPSQCGCGMECRSVENYAAIVEGVKAFRITDWPLFAKCCEWARGGSLEHFLLPQAGACLETGRFRAPCPACSGCAAVSQPLRDVLRLRDSAEPPGIPCSSQPAAYVTGVVLIGFLLHPVHHVDPAWFAILGAIVL